MILLGSMALGLVHIITGMAISFVRKLQNGAVLDAVFEEVTWWVVFLVPAGRQGIFEFLL